MGWGAIQPAVHGDPLLDVAPLQPADPGGVVVGERPQIAVLHGDERRVGQGEFDLAGG